MDSELNGIQQIGIGVTDAQAVFNWYRKHLGFDILVFEDESPATLMTQYTGGTIEHRYALLSMNMKGGGGLEIWQFKNRKPQEPKTEIEWGDLGVNAMKIRCCDLRKAHASLEELELPFLTGIVQTDESRQHFLFEDPWGNRIEVISDTYVFCETKSQFGGVLGAVIGVSQMEESLSFYKKFLGYDQVLSDRTGSYDQFTGATEKGTVRRVVLRQSSQEVGGFGALLGPTEIELIQVLDRHPKRIFENRFWGDLGFIHICFDVQDMDSLLQRAKRLDYSFTVDSADSFDMGKAAGRFSYVEDPDGTLIEFVQTHKVPLLKRLGWFIDLRNRNPKKPLPRWIVKAMRWHRVRKDL